MKKDGNDSFFDFIKLMDGADDNLTDSNIRNLAGGWTNHEIDSNLVKAYKDVIKNDMLFQTTSKYSPPGGFYSVLKSIVSFEREIHNDHNLSEQNIIIGHSGSNLLQNVLRALVGIGETVLINRPYYPNFVFQSELMGAKVAFYDTVDENLDCTISEEKIVEKIRGSMCKLYLLCLPDNPLGYVFDQKLISAISTALKENNGYLVIDFSYELFTYETLPAYSCNYFNENTVAIHSFSKSFGAMGRRFGYAVAASGIILKIKSNQIVDLLCPDSFHQIVYREYFNNYLISGELKSYLQLVNEKYKKVFQTCKNIFLQEEITFSNSKNGIYFYLKPDFDFKSIQNQIQKKNLKVLPGKLFGSSGDNYIRISIGPLIMNPNVLFDSIFDLISIIRK